MSKRPIYWKRRYRRIHAAALSLGQEETLLDLTPIDALEAKTFLEAPIDERIKKTLDGLQEGFDGIARSFQENDQALRDRIQKLIGNGTLINPSYNKRFKPMSWKLAGKKADAIFVDECVNYPLTPRE